MEICLIRHGIAEDRSSRYPDDRARPLTREGRERMQQAVTGIKALFAPDVVYTSPLVRARQTADIVAGAFPKVKVMEIDALCNGDDDELFEALARSGAERVALVGHEPLISATLSRLLTGDPDAVPAPFKKGAAALVSCVGPPQPGTGILEWFIQPAGLRVLRR